MPKTAIELISENVVNVRFKDLSEWNIKCAKDRLIDICGCIIGGATATGNAGLVKIVKEWGGKAEASIFVHGGQVPLGNAAMVNCISARSNDFGAMFANVGGKRIASHNSETTIPTALTFSDAYKVSGKEFLVATLLGDDTANRILAAGGWDFGLGWDGTMTIPIFGVIAIAGRFMRLSAAQIKDAFGISVNMVAGALQSLFDYALTFKLGQGLCARNGIFAAELAKEGWNGLNDALLGGKAYYYLYRGVKEISNPQLLTDDLGKTFYMEESFKRYPCGIPNAPFVIAGIGLHDQHGLDAQEIERIELALAPEGPGLYYAEPFRVGAAPQVNGIFSFQYTAISALVRGRLKIQDFSTESVCAPEILGLIGKSTIVRDPSLSSPVPGSRGSVRLRVFTKDGKILERIQSTDTAMHAYPTNDEILAKFWDQVDAFKNVDRGTAQRILDTIDHIEDLDDMRRLTVLFVPR